MGPRSHDITQVNVRDAFTGMPLDESAKLRVYENGWVEVLRSTFYVGTARGFSTSPAPTATGFARRI